jgi:hypothetical protein
MHRDRPLFLLNRQPLPIAWGSVALANERPQVEPKPTGSSERQAI